MVWTEITRREYLRDRARYASDATDAEWMLIASFLPPRRRLGRPRSVDLRSVVDAILYVLATGCQWRALPKDFPPKSTVHDYFVEWHCEGTLTRLHHALYAEVRELAGKKPTATTAIVDSQSVKSTEKGGPTLIPLATMRARKQRARSATSPSIRLG